MLKYCIENQDFNFKDDMWDTPGEFARLFPPSSDDSDSETEVNDNEHDIQ